MEYFFSSKKSRKTNLKTVPSSLPKKLPPISPQAPKEKKNQNVQARFRLNFPNLKLKAEEETMLQEQIKEISCKKIKSGRKLYNTLLQQTLDDSNPIFQEINTQRQILSPLKTKKKKIDNLSQTQRVQTEEDFDYQAELERSIMIQEQKFQEIASRNLRDLSCYDCWDEKISGQEWADRCQAKEGPHAYSPIYVDNEYVWLPVNVLSYNFLTSKFLVQVLSSGQRKAVKRLSLQFFDEDEVEFKTRLDQCKRLQQEVEQQLRFTQYVNTRPPEKVSQLRKEVKARLLQLAVEATRNISMDKYINTFRELISIVDEDYVKQMKKCLVIREMKDPLNKIKFQRLKIPIIEEEKETPDRGTHWIEDYSTYNYQCDSYINQKKEFIQRSWLQNDKYVKVTQHLMRVSSEFSKYKLMFTKLNELYYNLPFTLVDFNTLQKDHHDLVIRNIKRQWRGYLVTIAQEEMSSKYHFFKMDNDHQYMHTELHRLLQRLDFIMNTQMYKFVKSSVLEWVAFLKKFTYTEEDWIINDKPLLQIKIDIIKLDSEKYEEMKLQEEIRKQKTMILEDKSEDQGEQQDPDSPEEQKEQTKQKQKEESKKGEDKKKLKHGHVFTVDFNPYEQKLLSFLQRVIYKWTVQHINSINILECDLVPFMNVPKVPLCELTQNIPWIKQALEDIEKMFNQEMQGPRQLLDKFKKYEYIAQTHIDQLIESIFPSSNQEEIDPKLKKKQSSEDEGNKSDEEGKKGKQILSVAELRNTIMKYKIAKYEILNLSNDYQDFYMFRVICKPIKDKLSEKATQIKQAILQKIGEECEKSLIAVRTDFQRMIEQLERKPENEQELVDLKRLVKSVPQRKKDLSKELENISNRIELLAEFQKEFPKIVLFWDSKRSPLILDEVLRTGEGTVEVEEEKFKESLNKEISKWWRDLDSVKQEVEKVQLFGDYNKYSDYWSQLTTQKERIDELQEALNKINQKEALFELPNPTDQQDLLDLNEVFDPFYRLWRTVWDFRQSEGDWMSNKFFDLKGEDVNNKVENWYREVSALLRKMTKYPETIEVCTLLKQDIEKFKEIMPLIIYINNPAFKESYWDEMLKAIGIEENRPEWNSAATQLSILVDEYKLHHHLEIIREISERAQKEWQEEQRLKEMKEIWETQKLLFAEYKGAPTFVLKSPDEIFQLLDDQIATTQSMKVAKHVTPQLKVLVKQWEDNLEYISSVLDEWLKCQRTWMYLKPIMSSDDIKQALGQIVVEFTTVDNWWFTNMEQKAGEPDLMSQIDPSEKNDSNSLKEQLIANNNRLDVVTKALSKYLDEKRKAFPRFFFLSNDDLLSILSQTKDPKLVQPHLSKCFEAIHRIEFNGDLVVSMLSPEKEKIAFLSQVNVASKENKGCVEKWMMDIQNEMFKAIKDQIWRSMQDYAKSERTKWTLAWPGQVILAVDQIYWTQQVEEHLLRNELKLYKDILNAQLKDIVEMVRGNLSKLDRMTTSAMVVIDVHARDVVVDMVNMDVQNINDFKWTSQLRYYWRDSQLLVNMVNASLKYGFEYLGNSSRLVITPLTDRCYRTLMGAFHLYYGGAPEGPAGTGKTESTKDLAKAMAIKCVVFNCSDGLNAQAMGKFFKGLIASGSWCCFDEFNRIELEVLSVIAMQVSQIQNAIKEQAQGDSKKKKIVFEGTELDLQSSCAINITMNPGYAGRSELPDNLKALFRPCAMMVPDYALISEIVLYSSGFQDARNIAAKIVNALKLSSEQLSTQDHYDFGMRAVKAILTAAGQLKMQYKNEDESKLALRALIDVNVPKFTSNDIPLFQWITADLFPGVQLPQREYDRLYNRIEYNSITQNLVPTDNFKNKCIQLFETINVRHGLMLVGQTMSGKTSATTILSKSLPEKVNRYILNPKAITQGQMYGRIDEASKEWYDGVLGIIIRNCSNDESSEWKWVIFDGPVDAVWIENMNTVLDDNKMLCLNSGETIPITSTMRLIFEVEDLKAASPATVSRCGMIYLEPSQLGWQVLIQSYFDTINEKIAETAKQMYGQLLWPLLVFTKKYCFQPLPISDNEMIKTALVIFNYYLGHYKTESKSLESAQKRKSFKTIFQKSSFVNQFLKEKKKEDKTKSVAKKDAVELPKDIDSQARNFVIFSCVWAIGGSIDEKARPKFQEFLQQILEGVDVVQEHKLLDVPSDWQAKQIPTRLPANKSIFDVLYNIDNGAWITWDFVGERYNTPTKKFEFQDIIVPTKETYRMDYQIKTLCSKEHHVLLTGSTGTSKTITITNTLKSHFKNEKWMFHSMAFSAQTTAFQAQIIIEGQLDSRRKVNLPPNDKRMIIFVDDLCMPQKEKYGAQPPIELLRQWMDTGGWYNLEQKDFRKCQNIQFVAAMGPPTGGRNAVTQRYLRHFVKIYVEPFSVESLNVIYGHIMDWFLNNQDFDKKILELKKKIIEATIDIFQRISKEMLPTPKKSHYTYNLRDLSKVFQGISQGNYKFIPDDAVFLRLWLHECFRVFCDRLIDQTDRNQFKSIITEVLFSHFKKTWESAVGTEQLIFAAFGDDYIEHPVTQTLKDKVEESLRWYNEEQSPKMDLVLFQEAIKNVTQILRVLKQPNGHALLIGVGGSGLRSLTRLAAFIAEYKIKTIEINKNYNKEAWNEDLRALMMITGAERIPTVFLLTDAQIVQESFLEDINSILNYGDIPNLMTKENKTDILSALENDLKRRKDVDYYELFIENCRKNLHIVFRMSPIGDDFRRRLRMFPSLVNCMTINWFLPWSNKALKSVAWTFLENQTDLDNKQGIINICVDMQERVTQLCDRYLQELGRYYYVTPTSYLELIAVFQKLLQEKKNKDYLEIMKYKNGVQKLFDTDQTVKLIKDQLKELIPQLEQASIQTAELMKNLTIQQQDADIKRAQCEEEKQKAEQIASEATAISEECQKKLEEAMPIYNSAVAALNTLDKNHLIEMRALAKPPDGVKLTMEVICLFFNCKPVMVPREDGRGKIPDWWETSKKQLLTNPQKLLNDLIDYPKDNISPEIINKVVPYTKNPKFDPKIIVKASKAAEGMCQWSQAIVKYDEVLKVIRPKQADLAQALEKKRVAEEQLAKAQQDLQGVLDLLAQLQANYDEALAKKEKLEKDKTRYEQTIDRADRLLKGLAGEKGRWAQTAQQKEQLYTTIIGDVLISAGVIAYLGAFFREYRQQTVKAWCDKMARDSIICSQNFSLEVILGNELEINKWKVNELPSDSFSVDNAIILKYSSRWPLLIDPQGQAHAWITKTMKSQESHSPYKILRLSQTNFLRELGECCRNGFKCLIENAGEKFDPALQPLLSKEINQTGGSEASIKIGDESIPFDAEFQLFITTKLPKPHYSPEICVRITLLNFTTTEGGLEEQLLTFLVSKEDPASDEQRIKQIQNIATASQEQQETENKILQMLKDSKGDILEDESLCDTLTQSKQQAEKIKEQMETAQKVMLRVQQVRSKYNPVAVRASQLFFVVADLANLENMYQYSLEFYKSVFSQAINIKAIQFQDRVEQLITNFTRLLYHQVSRGLFEKDKLLFSFNMCTKIMIGSEKLTAKMLRFLVMGGTLLDTPKPNPTKLESGDSWLTTKQWAGINELATFPGFQNFDEDFIKTVKQWESIWYSPNPIEEQWPNKWNEKLNQFQKLMVIRLLRPDKVIQQVQMLIKEELGEEFINPPSFELEVSYSFSENFTPLIFILSPGADPMSELRKLSQKKMMNKKFYPLSLGDGQDKKAEEAIDKGIEQGGWVALQNCHLYQSWMPALEKRVEEINPNEAHSDFRLWLTAAPSDAFPVSILQIGIKITNEPPKGLRNNLKRCYLSFDQSEFEGCLKSFEFKKLLWGLSFFHASILERRKFGPIGWNIPYEFSQSDLAISVSQLRIFLNEQEQIPWDALKYMAAEANYGGRVTDPWDRRCINTVLENFYIDKIFDANYQLSESGLYKIPEEMALDGYLKFIDELPYNDKADIFGLHENAELTSAISDSNQLMDSVLSLLPRTASSGEGKSTEDIIKQKAQDIQAKLPDLFDIEASYKKYPDDYKESMNTVLTQEQIRFNKLLRIVKSSLSDLQKAMAGKIVMSQDLENVSNALYDNKIPDLWSKNAYPSLKPLGSWVEDFLRRLNFIQEWFDKGAPTIFWLSGFYFTQSFLTGTLQNYSRRNEVPIDTLTFEFNYQPEGSRPGQPPQNGCYIDGLFLEGSSWSQSLLSESQPKILYSTMPVIHFKPLQKKDKQQKHTYLCPIYKTSARAGTLSTTGHSTNFILAIDLPMQSKHTERHWIQRGVALLTQLNY